MSNEQKFERLKIKTFIGHEFSICGGVEAFDKSVHATHAEEAIPLRFKFDEETFDISACGLRDLLRGDFYRVTAERDALQALLTAADERADVLEGLLRSLPEGLKELSGCENTAGVDACIDYIEQCIAGLQLVSALKPALATNDEHVCSGCGSKGWTANCAECVPY